MSLTNRPRRSFCQRVRVPSGLGIHWLLLEVGRTDPAGFGGGVAFEITLVETGSVGGDVLVEEFAVAEHAGIFLGFEFVLHLGEQGGFALGLHRVACEVVDAIAVAAEIVELLGGADAEVEMPEFVGAVFASHFQDECFGGAGVGIEVTGLRVACGPAGGLVVLQKQPAVFDHATDGVTPVVRAADIGAFFADEDVIAASDDLPGFVAFPDLAPAFAGDGFHAAVRLGDACHIEQGGGDVGEVDKVIDDASGVLDFAGPANGERDVIAVVVSVAFDAGEGHAVVGGDDDEGVIELAALFEFSDHETEVTVGVLHFEGVVEHVVADFFGVGPVGGHAVDVAEFFAAFVDAALVFVTAMGLGAAIPEAPGFAGFSGVEERVEIGSVIVVAHGFGRRWGFVLVEGFAGDEAGFAGGVVGDARAPAFAGDAHVPAFFGKDFGPAFEFGGEHGHVIAGFFELPSVAPGEHDGAGGGAFGDGGVGVFEEQPFFGDAVKGGCRNPRGAIGSCVRTPVVGDGEEDVRQCVSGRQR